MYQNRSVSNQKGSIAQAIRDDGLIAISWKDKSKNPTNVLSNLQNPNEVKT